MPSVNIYNRYVPGEPVDSAHNRLIAGPHDGAPPPIIVAPQNNGETLAISLYFFDQGTDGAVPFRCHRYQGATVEVNCYAFGNAHMYAIATSTTEIAPAATAPQVIRSTAGVAHDQGERQRVVFASPAMTGRFTLTFPGPGIIGWPSGVVAPRGTTAPIDPRDGIAGIQAAIRALPFYIVYNGIIQPVSNAQWSPYLQVTGTATDFTVLYQDPIPNPNQGAGPVPMLTVDASDIQYAFGYTVSLALTAVDFLNLFLPANAPAYLNVILTPSGFPVRLTAQVLLIQSTPNTAPVCDFTADRTTAAPGDTIRFSDLSTNSPTNWAWDFGDGTTSTDRLPSKIYAAAGSYTVTLSVANGGGGDTETKTSYINISLAPPPPSGEGLCSGGLGINPPLPCNYFDGDYNILTEVETPRREMMEEHPFLDIWHQTYEIARNAFERAEVGSVGGIGGYIARDTPWQDLGSHIIRFTRVSHNVPPDRQFSVSIDKTLMGTTYTFVNGVIVDMGIIAWTDKVQATCVVHYYMEGTAQFAAKRPSVQVIPIVGIGKWMYDFETGFPFNGTFANPAAPGGVQKNFTHNGAVSFISSSTERVIGKLWCVKNFYG